MSPPLSSFPVSDLPYSIQTATKSLKRRSRKLPPNFTLENCALFELVQYSCTTMQTQMERTVSGQEKRMECRPFVRLFRRCEDRQGKKVFHVETTAWEGEHMWVPDELSSHGDVSTVKVAEKGGQGSQIANYGKSFWARSP